MMNLNSTHTCDTCGGTILGDGITVVLHCENIDLTDSRYVCVEPDAPVIMCIYHDEGEWPDINTLKM